jgi:thiosulfate/3-mercaptopyruvate sulfurtransferase
MKRLILIPLLFLWAQAAVAASPIIVDGHYVAEAIARNAVVWDVRAADAYAKGHIAGAISIGDAAKVLRDENTEDFIATDRIEKILGAAGLDPNRETIVYGSRGTWNPYFGLYTLQYFGGSNVRVYHDGIEDWVAAGRAISRDASQLPPVALKLEINPTAAVTTKEMVARLNNPNVQIVDVRTPREFNGEDIRAIRGGHIPGAINIPYEQNWIDPETPAKLARKQVQQCRHVAQAVRGAETIIRKARSQQGNHCLLPEWSAFVGDRGRASAARLHQRQGLRFVLAGLRQYP